MFKGLGHEQFGFPRSSLKIKLAAQEHADSACFSRKGDDLIYTHKLSLVDALSCVPIQFETMDGRRINLNLD